MMTTKKRFASLAIALILVLVFSSVAMATNYMGTVKSASANLYANKTNTSPLGLLLKGEEFWTQDYTNYAPYYLDGFQRNGSYHPQITMTSGRWDRTTGWASSADLNYTYIGQR